MRTDNKYLILRQGNSIRLFIYFLIKSLIVEGAVIFDAEGKHCCLFVCRYSAAANKMTHQCECCQEAIVSKKSVELTCADGSKVNHSYTAVDTCSCRKADCVPGTTSEPLRRRRR